MPTLEAPPVVSPFFAGMDRAEYPGDQVMEALMRNTNLAWTGFYLTPAPSQGRKLGWMGKHDFLRGLGWGIAPIYVGRQVHLIPGTDHRVSKENGRIDGIHAAQLARAANFASGAVIFLDFEHGAGLPEEFPPPKPGEKPKIGAKKVREYFQEWAGAVRAQGFKAGVYCLQGIAGQMFAAVPGAVVWTVNLRVFGKKVFKSPFPEPAPTDSGVPGASMWQLQQALTIEFNDLRGAKKHLTPVDLDSSDRSDPSGIGRGRKEPAEPRVIPKF